MGVKRQFRARAAVPGTVATAIVIAKIPAVTKSSVTESCAVSEAVSKAEAKLRTAPYPEGVAAEAKSITVGRKEKRIENANRRMVVAEAEFLARRISH